jgi:hypothetical protein
VRWCRPRRRVRGPPGWNLGAIGFREINVNAGGLARSVPPGAALFSGQVGQTVQPGLLLQPRLFLLGQL